MRVSAKVDYALRALAELAAAPPGPVKAEQIATAQSIPLKFLENILLELRRVEIVTSRRGAEGGYRLARPAAEVSWSSAARARSWSGTGRMLASVFGQVSLPLLNDRVTYATRLARATSRRSSAIHSPATRATSRDASPAPATA
jgi:Iron-dependent Transcriptional regulator